MREVSEALARAGKGIEGDERASGRRGVTLLSAERWVDVVRDVGKQLPWHARRANILVGGIDLAATIGKRVRVGDVELHVWGETRPCRQMDEICPGLRAALEPDTRGGVHAEALNDGIIRVADGVRVVT